MTTSHLKLGLSLISEWNSLQSDSSEIVLDGRSLTVATAAAISSKRFSRVLPAPEVADRLRENVKYFLEQLSSGHVIYGVNTGYGGSADVRSFDFLELQRSLVRHLNIGFGDKVDYEIIRTLMAVRANSLARGYSGVRPEVVDMLCQLLNYDIVPVVPLRGSISASGDLCPTSYVAAVMAGRPDAVAIVSSVRQVTAPAALAEVGLKPIVWGPKEALAVVNAASVAASWAAVSLFDTGVSILLTQAVTALMAEALMGRLESFYATIHDTCLPHPGNIEVAANVRSLLSGSSLVQTKADWRLEGKTIGTGADEGRARLKQDRYALRTAAQWLGPAVETWVESVRRVTVELNSANDNPLIDDQQDEILHCGNFQGIATTVAMDQVRQSIQLCGRLVFAQVSELLNHTSGHGLSPNLCGADVCVDFGFKGTDTATASYMSELDHVTPPLTNHVHSAEMHNQCVNSMALVSARTTSTALKLLQMMLTNALCALCQAVDLRWLERRVKNDANKIIERYNIHLPEVKLSSVTKESSATLWYFAPWYDVVFSPRRVANTILEQRVAPTNGIDKEKFVEEFVTEMKQLVGDLTGGKFTDEVAQLLGKGTSRLYLFVRRTLSIPFNDGRETLDNSLQQIFDAIKQRRVVDVLQEIFSDVEKSN